MPGSNRAARRKKHILRRAQDKQQVVQVMHEAQYITALMNQEILRLRVLLDGAGIDWRSQRIDDGPRSPAEARLAFEQEAEAEGDEAPASAAPQGNEEEVSSEAGSV